MPKRKSRLSRIEMEVYEREVAICKAFANTTRLQMLDLLARKEWSSSALQKELGITKPNLSQHVAILRAAGVVVTRRDGKQVHCSLAMPEVEQACKLIKNVLRAQLKKGKRLDV